MSRQLLNGSGGCPPHHQMRAERMPLSPGTSLGPYEIEAPLGAGGMSEVYKARDTRLDRGLESDDTCHRRATGPPDQHRWGMGALTEVCIGQA